MPNDTLTSTLLIAGHQPYLRVPHLGYLPVQLSSYPNGSGGVYVIEIDDAALTDHPAGPAPAGPVTELTQLNFQISETQGRQLQSEIRQCQQAHQAQVHADQLARAQALLQSTALSTEDRDWLMGLIQR